MNNAPIKDQKSLLPALELPKGGGAINSIGEKFSVNTLTGTGTASVEPEPLLKNLEPGTGTGAVTPRRSVSLY